MLSPERIIASLEGVEDARIVSIAFFALSVYEIYKGQILLVRQVDDLSNPILYQPICSHYDHDVRILRARASQSIGKIASEVDSVPCTISKSVYNCVVVASPSKSQCSSTFLPLESFRQCLSTGYGTFSEIVNAFNGPQWARSPALSFSPSSLRLLS
ncbi:hypothetical protein E1B28_008591 [Marasmius oreades]|uniref:Uncharacterized protein n=1 Tax=Marasmius oreades TaxID=181124 RepID=A0A9P7UUF7_9AGAR|nr:uncharacterized protein E1B28_008591 [Marasmius oreades]KAG7092224.1 hypothetical protein E1B28_008591 [Marasmius oreades]